MYYCSSVPKKVKTTEKILHNQNNSFLNFHIIIITFSQDFKLDLVRNTLILVPFTHTLIRWRKQSSLYILQTPTTLPVSSSTLTWLPGEHLWAATLLRDFCLLALFICCLSTPLKFLCNSGMVRHFFKKVLLRQSHTWAGEGKRHHSQGGVSASHIVWGWVYFTTHFTFQTWYVHSLDKLPWNNTIPTVSCTFCTSQCYYSWWLKKCMPFCVFPKYWLLLIVLRRIHSKFNVYEMTGET